MGQANLTSPDTIKVNDCQPIFYACSGPRVVIVSQLPCNITAEYAINSFVLESALSSYSSLERLKKQLKSLSIACGLPTWQVLNPLWLHAGPIKLSGTEMLALLRGGGGSWPRMHVRGYRSAARLVGDIPGWQRLHGSLNRSLSFKTPQEDTSCSASIV